VRTNGAVPRFFAQALKKSRAIARGTFVFRGPSRRAVIGLSGGRRIDLRFNLHGKGNAMSPGRFTILSMLLLAGCTKTTGLGDPLGTAKTGTVVYATTQCVAAHPDGVQCNKKTCAKDSKSDCAEFASACLNSGHYYAGSNDGGTCSRIL
jgi:hypothetical protein